jgi:polysaccharide pyruvyl transferase WcaK-like protein
MNIFQGFDFYGAGNIGDDLMMAGFIDGLENIGFDNAIITSLCGYNINSQKKRFPNINWLETKNSDYDHDIWLGLGDTPIQLTSSDWMLRYLENIYPVVSEAKRKILINIGVEKEAIKEKKRFSNFLNRIDQISTRDDESAYLLSNEFDVNEDKIIKGSDLANISLSNLSSNYTSPKYDIGFILGAEDFNSQEINNIREYIYKIASNKKIVFIANDVRKNNGFEYSIFKNITKWQFFQKKIDFLTPNYQEDSVEKLLEPIASCKTIISTRYHGLLIGAWMGCKVAGIGSRSKVKSLCSELNISFAQLPINKTTLEILIDSATEVKKETLVEMKEKAIKGINLIK